MGALNIKNEEAHRLARDIARATGETLTGAVVTALRARKAELDAKAGPDPEKLALVAALGRKYGPIARRLGLRADDDGDLYDEQGLPK